MLARILQWLRLPGLVRPLEYRDPETGALLLKVKTSPRYTVIVTPQREFFFERESGKLDGIGMMSVDDPLPMNGLLADRIRELRLAHAQGEQPGQS